MHITTSECTTSMLYIYVPETFFFLNVEEQYAALSPVMKHESLVGWPTILLFGQAVAVFPRITVLLVASW